MAVNQITPNMKEYEEDEAQASHALAWMTLMDYSPVTISASLWDLKLRRSNGQGWGVRDINESQVKLSRAKGFSSLKDEFVKELENLKKEYAEKALALAADAGIEKLLEHKPKHATMNRNMAAVK